MTGTRKRRSANGPTNNPRTKYGHRPRFFFTPTSPLSIADVRKDMTVDTNDIIIITVLVSTVHLVVMHREIPLIVYSPHASSNPERTHAG